MTTDHATQRPQPSTSPTPWWWAVDRAHLTRREQRIFDAGHQYGATWGIDHGRRQRDLELDWSDGMSARDDRLARRIVALLLQHDYNGQLVDAIAALAPYAERGIRRQATR